MSDKKSKKSNATSKPRTKVKNLTGEAKALTKAEQKKIKGGDWLTTPAGHVKQ